MARKIELKPRFLERMKDLSTDEEDFAKYLDYVERPQLKSIRCNKLKINPEKLKVKLEEKGWEIELPWKDYPEVMVVKNELEPGELGRTFEHLLGYYYIQELASMLPIIALKPKPGESVLDLCASPGSKTTQMAAEMNNTGSIIANEPSLGRIKILASNLEKNGVTNAIITRDDGIKLNNNFREKGITFDKILVDAPCSGEGTNRSTPKSRLMWNPNTIKKLSKLQLKLFRSSFEVLKIGGEMIYSTCTHAPEENEYIASEMLKEFGDQIEIEKISLPVNCRPGMTGWRDKEYLEEVKDCCRVHPQDSDTEGFFVSKFRRIK